VKLFPTTKQTTFYAISLLCWLGCAEALAQTPKPESKPASVRRLPFAQAQKLLAGEAEGNLEKRLNRELLTYTRTRLSNGQVLELYYPVTANQVTGKRTATTAPGYGVLYESAAIYTDATRPRHALEDLIPDAQAFVAALPQLVARLEKRLRARLDYSRASMKKLDAFIVAHQRNHTTAETDAQLFQELTAYYGETLRRALAAEWVIAPERVGKSHAQNEPNLRVTASGAARSRLLKPWQSVLNALCNEDKLGSGLTKAFDADVAAAQG
jgi:hypothetical protein